MTGTGPKSAPKLATIYGGSGFVGRYIARGLAQEGWRVRVAVRRPNEALFVRTYGVVGQVEPVLCNIRDDISVATAMEDADVVINCVGILAEQGNNQFETVQAEGAARIARLAKDAGISRIVHISSIGASEEAESLYQQTKAKGEAAILSHLPDAVILRPSIIFGTEDQFFNRFAGMARLGPVLPLVGADTRFQPVYVKEVADAAVMAAKGAAAPGIYELGGPEVASFKTLMRDMLAVIHRRRLLLNMPFPVASLMGGALDLVQTLSFGIIKNGMITRDQVRNLRNDNVVSDDALGFDALGITPTSYNAILPEYLWRFRPSGQYDEITASAKNLRP